jgi:hypothetical protein
MLLKNGMASKWAEINIIVVAQGVVANAKSIISN